MTQKILSPFEKHVIEDKGTERPFTGEYLANKETGVYVCKRCETPLFRSQDKFESHCGWPSFDDEIKGAVKRTRDADGQRVEITCAKCGAHLGHVFEGEGMTLKNIRHCVNSISLLFVPAETKTAKTALFASGCFWGTEFHFAKAQGVLGTKVGFAGGTVANPTYEQVCTGKTAHLECVEVTYDATKTTYEKMLRLFFETHDFSQEDGQGPDIGSQYLSAVFTSDPSEREIFNKVTADLKTRGHKVATQLRDEAKFWAAEDYHQKYYFKNAKTPYCHVYRKIW